MPMTSGQISGDAPGPVGESIARTLERRFAPSRLEVLNESHLHSGHAGHDGSGESHFRVRIRSREFEGMNRVAIHRAINAALADQLRTVHALAIDAAARD